MGIGVGWRRLVPLTVVALVAHLGRREEPVHLDDAAVVPHGFVGQHPNKRPQRRIRETLRQFGFH